MYTDSTVRNISKIILLGYTLKLTFKLSFKLRRKLPRLRIFELLELERRRIQILESDSNFKLPRPPTPPLRALSSSSHDGRCVTAAVRRSSLQQDPSSYPTYFCPHFPIQTLQIHRLSAQFVYKPNDHLHLSLYKTLPSSHTLR